MIKIYNCNVPNHQNLTLVHKNKTYRFKKVSSQYKAGATTVKTLSPGVILMRAEGYPYIYTRTDQKPGVLARGLI